MQGSEWQGPAGQSWADEWRRTDRSFAGLTTALDAAILAAAPDGPFAAVDLGCGAGQTSLSLADARPDASITGIDLSPDLVSAAIARQGRRPDVRFVLGDVPATVAAYGPLDLLFSRHGVMFFDDPVAAFTAIRAAARPGAKLVFSCFREIAANPWASEIGRVAGGDPPSDPATAATAPSPFAFGDPERVRTILAGAGWADAAVAPVDFAYRAGEGADPVADAVDYFSRIGPAARALRSLPEAERPAARDCVAEVCARFRHGDAIDFPGAAWLVTARNPVGAAQ